jgi:hypothetical protein
MQRGIAWSLVAPLIALGLAGCRFFDYEAREPWRAEAEEKCLAERLIQPTSYLEPGEAVNGKGTCGMTKPFKVAAVSGGFVEFKPKATLSCPLVANIEAWFHEAIQPAAMAWYGSPVTEIKQISAYSCRTMNGQPGMPISEHSYGNALDIASFRFADGREVDFKRGWKGKPEEQGFLRAVHAAACERFSTVLAPGSNAFHYDHIHVDLARRASGRNVCNPAPMTLPPPPRYPGEVPVARAPSQQQPVAHAPQVAEDRTSPWVHGMPQPRSAQHPAPGPMVVEREAPTRAVVGPPLVLGNHGLGSQGSDSQGFGNQAPPPDSLGAAAPLAQRVRDSLGIQPQGAPMRAPASVPARQNPYGLVPPGRIPSARTGADATVTGSIPENKSTGNKKDERKVAVDAGLMSPKSIAEQAPSSEPASVFNLLPAKP